jgi:Arc/MetJ-type ribon-helix-helix transcriptional regulator
VVREALRLMVEKDAEASARLSSLRVSLQEGLESGPVKRFDVEEVKKKARSQKAGGHA